MGIKSASANANTSFLVAYSGFLGMLHLNDETAKAAVKTVKASVDPEVWKQGFTGLNGPSGAARKALAASNITPLEVSGYIDGISVETVGQGQQQSTYLRLVLGEQGTKVFMSLDITHSSTQHLVRKLAAVNPADYITLSMFATTSEKDGKIYANHYASVHAGPNQQKVAGIDVQELIALKEAAKANAAKSKIKDPKAVASIVNSAVAEYHIELIKGIQQIVETQFNSDMEQQYQGADA